MVLSLQSVVMDTLRALVTSEARAKVLTALFSATERGFYQQELSRVTGLPLAAIQRELRRLGAAGIVDVQVVAGRRVFSASHNSAIYAELRSMILKSRGAPAVLQRALAERRSIELAWIFGSVATGSASATSDVDLMVLGAESSRALRVALLHVERELGSSVNEHVMTTNEWSARLRKRDPFISNVRAGPKLWIVGDETTLRGLDSRRPRR